MAMRSGRENTGREYEPKALRASYLLALEQVLNKMISIAEYDGLEIHPQYPGCENEWMARRIIKEFMPATGWRAERRMPRIESQVRAHYGKEFEKLILSLTKEKLDRELGKQE